MATEALPEAEAIAPSSPYTLRVLHAPKEGNTDEQYEDASTFTYDEAASKLTVAVSDGASSAVFAREWARLLVGTFGANAAVFPPDNDGVKARVAELGREWRQSVENKATTWHAQEKLASGSSATLLVATWDLAAKTLDARAVGDVCLFLLRDDKVRYGFPFTRAAKMNDRPDLLCTEPNKPLPKVHRFALPYETGDRFLLMTDALAAWFLTEWEARRKPWQDLPDDQVSLAPWLKTRRDSGRLKNDDVTLIDILF